MKTIGKFYFLLGTRPAGSRPRLALRIWNISHEQDYNIFFARKEYIRDVFVIPKLK